MRKHEKPRRIYGEDASLFLLLLRSYDLEALRASLPRQEASERRRHLAISIGLAIVRVFPSQGQTTSRLGCQDVKSM